MRSTLVKVSPGFVGMPLKELVVCANCGIVVEPHLTRGWISVAPYAYPQDEDGVADTQPGYQWLSVLLPKVDPNALCYCPECALNLEIGHDRDIRRLRQEFRKGDLESADALMLRQGLVREARGHLVRKVIQLNYGRYYFEAIEVYSDYCYGFPPVLRDANGRNTKVRIEILEGTPKEVAIVELSRALMAIETDEDVVRWLTADDEAQEPADLSEDDEVSPGSAEDTELPY